MLRIQTVRIVSVKSLKNFKHQRSKSSLYGSQNHKVPSSHPDHNLYKNEKHLEVFYSKHAILCDLFENSFEEFFKMNIGLKFLCLKHQTEMLTNIFSY